MTSFKQTLKTSTVALVTSGALMAGMGAMSSANAGIAELFPLNSNGETFWEDTSGERWVDVDSSGDLNIGDRLQGILKIDEINILGMGPHDLSGLQLTAVFDTEVLTMDDEGSGGGFSFADYTFGPTAGFEGTYGIGAIVAFFTDTDEDFALNGCGTLAACEGNVTDGDLLLTLGFDAEMGDLDGWTAEDAITDPSLGTTFGPDQRFTRFYINFSVLTNNTGRDFSPGTDCWDLAPIDEDAGPSDPSHSKVAQHCDVTSTGSVEGSSGVDSPYDVTDDVSFLMATIPEPGMLGLFGLGLVSLVATRRRLNKKA